MAKTDRAHDGTIKSNHTHKNYMNRQRKKRNKQKNYEEENNTVSTSSTQLSTSTDIDHSQLLALSTGNLYSNIFYNYINRFIDYSKSGR